MTKETLYVHGDRLLVELVADKATTDSGLYTGGLKTNDPRELEMQSGKVVKIGAQIILDTNIRANDVVSFDSYCGMEFQDEDGITYKVLNEYDVRFKTK
jgi:co-chaperonin GroES (HSP10)